MELLGLPRLQAPKDGELSPEVGSEKFGPGFRCTSLPGSRHIPPQGLGVPAPSSQQVTILLIATAISLTLSVMHKLS